MGCPLEVLSEPPILSCGWEEPIPGRGDSREVQEALGREPVGPKTGERPHFGSGLSLFSVRPQRLKPVQRRGPLVEGAPSE
jgi:hypothetical protein